jgi:hypothetical protein
MNLGSLEAPLEPEKRESASVGAPVPVMERLRLEGTKVRKLAQADTTKGVSKAAR